MDELKQRCRQLLPDVARWVETRDLLDWEATSLIASGDGRDFVVWSEADGFGSVVGGPAPSAIATAAADCVELLAFRENMELVQQALPNYTAEPATILVAPKRLPASPGHPCRLLGPGELAACRGLTAALRDELAAIAEEETPIMAAFDGAAAVAFAYVASETESLWDVSIDTLETHRRMGFASAAVVALAEMMLGQGKSAVWGALQSNSASQGLARRLGFVEVDQLWVVSRP